MSAPGLAFFGAATALAGFSFGARGTAFCCWLFFERVDSGRAVYSGGDVDGGVGGRWRAVAAATGAPVIVAGATTGAVAAPAEPAAGEGLGRLRGRRLLGVVVVVELFCKMLVLGER